MTWADVGIIALFISGIMTLITRSKLSLFVFCYLLGILFIQSIFSELHPEGKLTLFPAVPILIIFSWFCLEVLDKTYIQAKITPITIGIAMLFEAICITEDLFDQSYFVGYYGMVIGITNLLAALEGAIKGGSIRFIGSNNTSERRGNFRMSWLFHSLQASKKD